MKKSKRLFPNWMASETRRNDVDKGSCLRSMMDIKIKNTKKTTKAWKLDENNNNSLLIHEDSLKRANENTLVDHKNALSRNGFVLSSQIWDGKVLAVQEECFIAKLNDRSGKQSSCIIEIKKSFVNHKDWDVFFREGFEFEWVFKEVITNGTFSRKNGIRFTPITKCLSYEIDEIVKKKMAEYSYMLKEDV